MVWRCMADHNWLYTWGLNSLQIPRILNRIDIYTLETDLSYTIYTYHVAMF